MEKHKDFYKWTVELAVHKVWVADGFDFKNEDDLIDMLSDRLPHASSDHELKAKILKAPDPKKIRKEQGYTE